jgi:hypothetical protein
VEESIIDAHQKGAVIFQSRPEVALWDSNGETGRSSTLGGSVCVKG